MPTDNRRYALTKFYPIILASIRCSDASIIRTATTTADGPIAHVRIRPEDGSATCPGVGGTNSCQSRQGYRTCRPPGSTSCCGAAFAYPYTLGPSTNPSGSGWV